MLEEDTAAAETSVNVSDMEGEPDDMSGEEFFPASSDLPTPTTRTKATQFRGKPHRKARGRPIIYSPSGNVNGLLITNVNFTLAPNF